VGCGRPRSPASRGVVVNLDGIQQQHLRAGTVYAAALSASVFSCAPTVAGGTAIRAADRKRNAVRVIPAVRASFCILRILGRVRQEDPLLLFAVRQHPATPASRSMHHHISRRLTPVERSRGSTPHNSTGTAGGRTRLGSVRWVESLVFGFEPPLFQVAVGAVLLAHVVPVSVALDTMR